MLKRTTWDMRFAGVAARFSRRALRCPSGRPSQAAAALFHGVGDLRAVDRRGNLEEVLGGGAARLRVADEEGREQLVLSRAIEGRVRAERDLRRQMEVLQRFGHLHGV